MSKKESKSYKKATSTSKAAESAVSYSKSPLMKVIKQPKVAAAMTDDSSILTLIHTSRTGLKYIQFEKISMDSAFTLEEWSEMLHLSTRSMLRYKKDKKSFDPIQSEKILQIALLYEKGIEVFGSAGTFDSWLASEVVVLGGLVPKSLLDSSFGIQLVSDQLGRIAHGVLA